MDDRKGTKKNGKKLFRAKEVVASHDLRPEWPW